MQQNRVLHEKEEPERVQAHVTADVSSDPPGSVVQLFQQTVRTPQISRSLEMLLSMPLQFLLGRTSGTRLAC